MRKQEGLGLIEILIIISTLLLTLAGGVVWRKGFAPTSTPIAPTPSFQKELKKEPEIGEKSAVKVSLSELVGNPAAYVDKAVQIMATVKCIDRVSGRTDWVGNGDWFLEDSGYRVKVFTWAPTHVTRCAPSIKDCPKPLTMVDYIEEKVELTGIFRELPKEEFINKKWTKVGTYYVIKEVDDVIIVP